MSDRARKTIIQLAGILIILLGIAAALLPLAPDIPPRKAIGSMLVAAGAIELLAAYLGAHRVCLSIAAAATVLAGLRLLLDPGAGFFEVFNMVILWLVIRSATLGFTAWRIREPHASWFLLAGAVDFLLAIGLLAGLPIALLVVGLFGPRGPIVDTFAWVFALSFIASGVLQIATANGAEREPA